MTTRIVIADDQTLIREGIVALLKNCENTCVVAEANNGAETLKAIKETKPDIVLLDLVMPVMNGFDVLSVLHQERNPVKTIVLSMFCDEKNIIDCIEAGASGFLSKYCEVAEVITAIRLVMETGFYFNQDTNNALLHRVKHQKLVTGGTVLGTPAFSGRELKVLQLIGEEHTSEEIGKKLFMSTRTVEGIRRDMIQKVGAKNIVGLFKYVYKNGLIEF